MTSAGVIRPAQCLVPPTELSVQGGFVTIDGERYARISDVDAMPPFLMSVVSDSDVWLFVGSNGAFTAGRRDPDHALFPSQTADKILRDPNASGVRTAFLVSRGGSVTLWEPWREPARDPGGAPEPVQAASTGPPSSSRRSTTTWACASAGASRPVRRSGWSGTRSSRSSPVKPSRSATSMAGTT